ncbi:SusD/RagB family nutrient-binding outer membrane lipoprotein [Pontibacter sp. G13]|uniref:SusD/RagB family nutrient-binding outer membrane lipoprotein n=1 Tax=Pontibacter sp. G13 TaxID=3074898 RepID=UPI00288BD3C2|nr:SusD/RagB family nutrient-binding outer membrane lipoprotein [Pontibacter sp. G13]WNJ18121.1 SusD/RagB family nutrient-binding outer membrane lipoprotein [Pontibacter sp. G13]
MKKLLNITWVVLLIASISACDEFGEELRTNPNNPAAVAPATLLTNVLRNLSGPVGDPNAALYAQYLAETQYTEDSRYQTVNFNFDGFYTGPLADLEEIISLNSDEATMTFALQSGSNANQIAVARILKAYYFVMITDRWGDVPYSAALKGGTDEEGRFNPSYDSQQSIYMSLFTELEEAVAQMDGGAPVEGDFLLGGNMDWWKIFANSLRMQMALRISEADASTAQAQFSAAMAAGVIGANAENIMYPYLADANNQNPWFARFLTRTDYGLSSTVVDMLEPLGDPRLESFGDPAPLSQSIAGMPYGVDAAAAGAITNDEISFPNSTWVRGQASALPIFTYAQMLFCQAEAAQRGWIAEDAGELYNAAVTASMEQWGITDADAISTYLGGEGVAYDAANGAELIGTQKWVALFLQGFEGWNEWRRTGYPMLSPAPAALSVHGGIPLRQGYPTSERDLNSDHWSTAVAGLASGTDDLDSPVWWDK